jgi:acyl carrier protein
LEPRSAGEPAAEPAADHLPPALPAVEEVRRKVVAAIAHALDLREDQIPLDASLEEELGAESLDFLDLAFILEREFRIRLPRFNLLERAETRYGQGVLVQDGVVTEQGLELLRRRMPEADPRRIAPGLRASELGRLVTAETFVRVVSELLVHKTGMLAAPCAACGGPLAASQLAPELLCAGCGSSLPLPPGDDLLL